MLRCSSRKALWLEVYSSALNYNLSLAIVAVACPRGGCLDSLERGTVEWNSGTVDWWNSGMVECADDDPVPTFPTYCACAV